ncbi:MAG: hypothetical protein ACOYL9_04640 [Ilumatobacteraceae bacterium]
MNDVPVRDLGVVTSIEMMFVLMFALASVALLGFVGRLHAGGLEVGNAAQAAARSASMTSSSAAARRAAQDSVDASPLVGRCADAPSTELTWSPSATGTWQGGAVTVTVRCRISDSTIAGIWLPGSRTLVMTDTQPIDRYQR